MSEPTPPAAVAPGTMRMSEAIESLTGFETIGIEDRCGRDMDALSGTRLTIGVVASMLKRSGLSTKDAWISAQAMSLKQLNEWFAPEPEVDVEDEPGKG
jgi:hypothetical protein